MRKILALAMTILVGVYSISYNKTVLEQETQAQESSFEEILVPEGFTPIRTFVDLARIGRSDDEMFAANGKFILINDIELPYISYSIDEINRGEAPETLNIEEANELGKYIRDYFSTADHANGRPLGAGTRMRGWMPIPEFSGIFLGNNKIISGLAGDRVRAIGSQETSQLPGAEMVGGLFSVVSGEIHDLTVEIGQTHINEHVLNLTLQVIRNSLINSIIHFSARGWVASGITNNGTYFEGPRGPIAGVGGIAGIMYGGKIINSSARSKTEDNHLRNIRMTLGGLVGIIIDGEIINSSSYVILGHASNSNGTPTSPPTSNASNHVGGLVGTMEVGKISNSYAKGEVFMAMALVAGLVGRINQQGDIEISNAFSGTIIHRVGFQSNTNRVSGLISHLIINSEHTLNISNVFSYTTFRTQPLADGFASIIDNELSEHSSFENIVVTSNTIARGVTVMTEEQLQNPLFVDNFLNSKYSVFHIEEPDYDGQVVFPTLNPNPVVIQRVPVRASESEILFVEGLRLPFSDDGFLYLTNGEFTLTLSHNARQRDFNLVITESDIKDNKAINIWSVTFNGSNDFFHELAFFKEGENIDIVNPPIIGRVFIGWFDDISGGEKVTTAIADHISVWARYHDFMIVGSTTPGAELVITSIELVNPENSFDMPPFLASANGTFEIFDLFEGTFLLQIRMNGFIDYERTIVVNQAIINLSHIELTSVLVYGYTLEFSNVIITDHQGVHIASLNNTLTTGRFSFSQLLDGEYFLIIERDGFVTRTESFVVNRLSVDLNTLFDETDRIKIQLTAVSITGTAKEGTMVSLYENDRELFSVIVGEDETFTLSVIVDPKATIRNIEYLIVARLETFDEQRATISILGNASTIFNFVQDELVTISGITSQRTRVLLLQDGHQIDYVVSNSFGAFEFKGIENGEFSLVFERAKFNTIIQYITVNYTSINLDKILLQRTAPDNSFVGYILQGILVTTILVGIYVVVYKKDKRKTTKSNG